MLVKLTDQVVLSLDDMIDDMMLESVDVQHVKQSNNIISSLVILKFDDMMRLDSLGFAHIDLYVRLDIEYRADIDEVICNIEKIQGTHEVCSLDFYKDGIKRAFNEQFEIHVIS